MDKDYDERKIMDKEEKEKMRNSPEMKRKIDKFMQEKLDRNYEDLRVDNPKERHFQNGFFEILNVDEEEVGVMNLELGMPCIVENNEVSKKVNLHKGDKIMAEIYSDPEDGCTNEWFFSKINKAA